MASVEGHCSTAPGAVSQVKPLDARPGDVKFSKWNNGRAATAEHASGPLHFHPTVTGILRTFLALAVALSHVPDTRMKIQLGVIAVMLFYFLSGNVMCRAYEKFRATSPRPLRSFYVDRFLRIWPAYTVAILLMVVLVLLFRSQILSFAVPEVGLRSIVKNLNLFCMNDNGLCKVPSRIIHTSWSLGSEIHFYVLLPLLVAVPFAAFTAAALASMGFHLYALLSMDPHSAHYWSYGSTWGTLFVFCMGICYARRDDARYRNLLGAIIAFQVACIITVYPMLHPQAFGNLFIMEMWLGVVLAAPLVFAAERAQGIPARVDHLIGSLSYPIFVLQVFAMGVADVLLGMKYPSRTWMVVFLVSLVATAALVAWLVERPAGRLRHRLMARPGGGADSAAVPAASMTRR